MNCNYLNFVFLYPSELRKKMFLALGNEKNGWGQEKGGETFFVCV